MLDNGGGILLSNFEQKLVIKDTNFRETRKRVANIESLLYYDNYPKIS